MIAIEQVEPGPRRRSARAKRPWRSSRSAVDAYRFLLLRWRMLWLPIVLLAIAGVAQDWWVRLGPSGSGQQALQPLALAVAVLQIHLTVRAQRIHLLGPDDPGGRTLVYGRLLLWSLAFLLICFALFVVVGMAVPLLGRVEWVLRGVGIAWTLLLPACVWLFARWSLVIAAIAVERPRPVRHGWRAGRGHGAKLLAGLLLVSMPPDATGALIDQLVQHLAGPGPSWPLFLSGSLAQALSAVGTAVTAAFAAITLRRLERES